MEIKTMTIEEIEARKAEIATLLDAEDTDLAAIQEEVRQLNEELETRKAAEVQREDIRKAVASGAGEKKTELKVEEQKMTNEEIRSSAAYVDAFARYMVSEDDKECRALLTEQVSGTVPVPKIVDDIIRTAWNNEPLLSRVKKTSLRGNLKVAFERSADPAYVHTEGTSAVTEEDLSLGIVEMIPRNVKKWITISDEAVTMGGEALVTYIYNELAYQITKKLAALVVADVVNADTSHSASAVGIPKINANPAVTTIPTAAANLSSEATNLCVVMNRLTEVAFLSAYAQGNFAIDPFAGLTKIYTDALPAFSAASTNATYAIVGDLSAIQVNFPEGEGVVFKFDDLSLAEADLVKVVGREYAAHAVTAPGRLARLTKAAG